MFGFINSVVINFFRSVGNYLPNFFGGLFIFCIGLVLASILKRLLLSIFKFFRLAGILEKTKLMKKHEVIIWEEVLVEVLRWTLIILFLIPTLEVWGLSRATSVINQFLFYLPNVIIAVVIGFFGIIISNMMVEVVKSAQGVHSSTANTLAMVTKGVIIFFTILVVMNQLGVAQDLIRILFTGIIAMAALAGGLAFGLGGREVARDILEEAVKKLKQK